MSYWESRQAREMYEAMEDAEQAAREIADIYAKASRELNYKITQIYERYRDKFELDDDEALKLLNQLRNPWDLDELRQRLEGLKGAEKKEILKELESPAYRARIERLENLQSEIDRMMRDVYNQEKKVSTDHYVDQYNQSYYREIYDLKKRTGLDFSFGYVDDKALNRILRTNWSGANYSQRIWGNTQGLADDLKTQLALAYLTGKNESEIATEIAKKYSTGAANARRLVRTESAYISGQAQAAADEEAGLDKYRILATLDLRTSDICREMDGQVFAYKDMEVGVNYPPFHPYCRTTVLSEIDDQDLSQLKRRSRDPATGEVKTFPGDITYQKWYEKEVAHNPEALFAEKVEKHRGADLKQYERYVERLGKKKVGSIDDFREKKYKNPDEFEKLKELYKNPEAAAGVQEATENDIIKDKPKEKAPVINFRQIAEDEWDKFKHSITAAQRKIIYGRGHFSGYVNSSNARKLNEAIRNGKPLSPEFQEIKDTLTEVISQNTIPENIEVIRYVSSDALENIAGFKPPKPSLLKSREQYLEEIEQALAKVKPGYVDVENNFLSTSLLPDKNVMTGKDVEMHIRVPEGTHCYITTNKRESEAIFGIGTELELESIIYDTSQLPYKWVATYTMRRK